MIQIERIAKYIDDFGGITQLDATRDIGVTQLAARICDMQRLGYMFAKETVKSKNRYGENVRFTRYSWLKDKNEELENGEE